MQRNCSLADNLFTPTQTVVRVYLLLPLITVGIALNTFNILLFTHKSMRHQHINWFLLSLAIADVCLLGSSLNILSLPVFTEWTGAAWINKIGQYAVRWGYPMGMTWQTFGVYITVMVCVGVSRNNIISTLHVSIHRYLGVCHPFRSRQWDSDAVVCAWITACAVFAVVFNAPRWIQLELSECLVGGRTSVKVVQSSVTQSHAYTFFYHELAYFIVMFALPFAVLIVVYSLIIHTIKKSSTARAKMSSQPCSPRSPVSLLAPKLPIGLLPTPSSHKRSTQFSYSLKRKIVMLTVKKQKTDARREHCTTLMLLAVVSFFLLCNSLAFVANFIPPSYPHYTLITEISNLLVNLNSSCTFIIYYKFGTKFRTLCRAVIDNLVHLRAILHPNHMSTSIMSSAVPSPMVSPIAKDNPHDGAANHVKIEIDGKSAVLRCSTVDCNPRGTECKIETIGETETSRFKFSSAIDV